MVVTSPDDPAATELATGILQLSRGEFDRFRAFVYGESGIHIPDGKLSLLSNRIRRRVKASGFTDFEKYYHYLTSSKGRKEVEKFIDAVTTNETFFFRTETQFDWFGDDFLSTVLAEARKGERARTLRVWSAACSTGEEPYSLAICLYENRFRLKDWSLTVLGTDISEGAIREAREGIFKARAVQGVSEARLRKCFTSMDDGTRWKVRPKIQEVVQLRSHNLMTRIVEEPFDCIFIRNVLIYFDQASKQEVVGHLVEALAPGGFLVVGPSEGVHEMTQSLERCGPLIYRKPLELAP
jgi:chemotaxis protein methyltransferase CheR